MVRAGERRLFPELLREKNQIQNSGAPNQFTFYPAIHRNGIFANYMAFHDRLNVLGGFMYDHDGYGISGSSARSTCALSPFFSSSSW